MNHLSLCFAYIVDIIFGKERVICVNSDFPCVFVRCPDVILANKPDQNKKEYKEAFTGLFKNTIPLMTDSETSIIATKCKGSLL
jgi:hypothetical protein